MTVEVDTRASPSLPADWRPVLLAFGGCASLGAGAVHAAAIGAHSEHRAAVWTFAGLALLQLGWGAASLTRSTRIVATVGVLINAGALVGWVVAKTFGIGLIRGLDHVEPVQTADGIAAGLAAAGALAALWWLARSHRGRPVPLAGARLSGAALASVLLAAVGMVAAGSHQHAGSGHVHAAAAIAPHRYDPTLPIDLGGVPGVSLQEQARAENLIALTLARLPQFADPAVASAHGFRSINDGITGFEHYINPAYVGDLDILDPDHPESLVYDVRGGGKKLVSAMFMLPPGSTLEDVPDVGGSLTQWHVHDNLCFSSVTGAVAGLTTPGGDCSPPLVKGVAVPMIHVWITEHPCGPFASLEGIAAGSIKAGETRLCDDVHGSS